MSAPIPRASIPESSAGVVLVVVANSVVVVSNRVELVVLVLPLEPHGQLSVIACPTAFCRQTKASVAEIGRSPDGAQMQAGVQVASKTAAFNMKRQSVDTGAGPLLRGWEQSPCAAPAGATHGAIHNAETSTQNARR